jgi:arylsulfatase A-like enzyme
MKFKLLFILIFSQAVVIAQSSRPNIIVFLVDDMGWQDTSVPFWKEKTPLNKRYHTPNMERLAQAGMKFTAAYSTPVCTPTRVSMLTGMNASRHGITNWTSPWRNDNTDAKDDQFDPAPWNINGLSPVPGIPKTVYATPFPQILKENGYFTIHVGKAHWASMGTPGSSPYNMGFMVNIAGHSAGHPQSYYGKENYGNIPGKSSVQAVPDLTSYHGTDTFLTEALTLEAIKTLEAPIRNKQPFFLNMAHYAIHTPIQADHRYFQKYLNAGLDTVEARYASLIEGMDKSLGDIMDYLRMMKADQNTVIIFMSDNGGLSLTPHRTAPAHTQNLPLKAGKGSVYEGGIRVPMVVSWPARIKPGTVTNQYVMIEDFFPTILSIAEVKKYEMVQEIDGRSMMPIFSNPSYTDTSRALIWHYPNKWNNQAGPGINYHSAIRKGSWKLVYSMRDGKKELYNLGNDIGEKNDLASSYPKMVESLYNTLVEKLQENKAPMMVRK